MSWFFGLPFLLAREQTTRSRLFNEKISRADKGNRLWDILNSTKRCVAAGLPVVTSPQRCLHWPSYITLD